MEDLKFTPEELEKVQEHFKQSKTKLTRTIFAVSAAALIFMFIPVQIFGKGRRLGMEGNFLSNYGLVGLVIVLIVLAILIGVFYKGFKIQEIKKDLEKQEKSPVRLTVRRVKPLKAEVRKLLMEEGNDSTHEIAFQQNSSGVNSYFFNKERNPELAKAKEMRLLLAKYSRFELSREILSNFGD